jgi:damage-control phosphatase, subfamily I
MKSTPRCLSCYIDDIAGALDLLDAPAKDKTLVLKKSLAYMGEHLDDNAPPSYTITNLHRILKRTLGMNMPFAKQRRVCLNAGIAVAATVRRRAARLSGLARFRFLVRWAVAANSLDFRTAGAGYGLSKESVQKTMDSYFARGMAVDHSAKLYAAARSARRVVYIPDNVGEIALDGLLVSLLRSLGAEVTVPMRGGPITSDAVMADALAAGMDTAASRVILAGPDTLGISFREMSKELSGALRAADLIIAKGQANYYVLSEVAARYPGAAIACLFTAKCGIVWKAFGCSGKSSIAAVIKKGGRS